MTNLPSSHSKIAESPVGSDSVMCTVAALPLGKVGAIIRIESGRKASTASATHVLAICHDGHGRPTVRFAVVGLCKIEPIHHQPPLVHAVCGANVVGRDAKAAKLRRPLDAVGAGRTIACHAPWE